MYNAHTVCMRLVSISSAGSIGLILFPLRAFSSQWAQVFRRYCVQMMENQLLQQQYVLITALKNWLVTGSVRFKPAQRSCVLCFGAARESVM